MLFTAVIPCYNEVENVEDIYNEIMKNEECLRSRELRPRYSISMTAPKTVLPIKSRNWQPEIQEFILFPFQGISAKKPVFLRDLKTQKVITWH